MGRSLDNNDSSLGSTLMEGSIRADAEVSKCELFSPDAIRRPVLQQFSYLNSNLLLSSLPSSFLLIFNFVC